MAKEPKPQKMPNFIIHGEKLQKCDGTLCRGRHDYHPPLWGKFYHHPGTHMVQSHTHSQWPPFPGCKPRTLARAHQKIFRRVHHSPNPTRTLIHSGTEHSTVMKTEQHHLMMMGRSSPVLINSTRSEKTKSAMTGCISIKVKTRLTRDQLFGDAGCLAWEGKQGYDQGGEFVEASWTRS